MRKQQQPKLKPTPKTKLKEKLGRRAPQARRKAILDAGLAVFAAQGFAATKLDDVAAEAGVAKGTIYLHFRDKEDLLQQIVREAVSPVIARLETLSQLPDVPTAVALGGMFEVFRAEVLGTSRKQVLHLVITEGARFPAIAEFYHREVVSRGMRLVGELLNRAKAKGELTKPGIASYPQLVFAPLIMALIWDILFERIQPLDIDGLLTAHRELLLAGNERPGDV
jgi:AcrR family transcriptional regulator